MRFTVDTVQLSNDHLVCAEFVVIGPVVAVTTSFAVRWYILVPNTEETVFSVILVHSSCDYH